MLFHPKKRENQSAALYLHVPFCKQACRYCNFHFSTLLSYQSVVVASMRKELMLRQSYLNSLPIATVYIGGGTPSLLDLPTLEGLLRSVFACFSVDPDAEITLEANPDDVTREKLQGWRGMGINRLSIGVQSFRDATLQLLHRAHTGLQAKKAMEWARLAFSNLNMDLIYAIPSTTNSDWQSDLDQALAFEPDHISAYCLTIEEKTVFGHWRKQGKIIETEDEVAAECFERCLETLAQKGYLHYETSNFCLPGRFSKHNLHYWSKTPYLGIGPGAHAYNGTHRHWNVSNNASYVRSIEQGIVPCSEEELSKENHANEYIMTSIRTRWGCDLEVLHKAYAVDLGTIRKAYIEQILQRGFACLDENTLSLTNRGKLIADAIASELFVDALDCVQP